MQNNLLKRTPCPFHNGIVKVLASWYQAQISVAYLYDDHSRISADSFLIIVACDVTGCANCSDHDVCAVCVSGKELDENMQCQGQLYILVLQDK